MSIEWLGLVRFAQAGLIGAKSLYDHVRGKAPHMNFEPGDDGVKLQIQNPRVETIIIEKIEASPPILGFLAGHELEDVARAIVSQHQVPDERALAVVRPSDDVSVGVMTFDPFGTSPPELAIKVRVHWRGATRGIFSKSSVARKISVRDVRDLQLAVDRNQTRIWSL